MKFEFTTFIIDLSIIMLMIWNLKIFVLNKTDKADIRKVIEDIPIYIRMLFCLFIDILMGFILLIDIGLLGGDRRWLMTLVIWSGWIWLLFILYKLRRNRMIYTQCHGVQGDMRLGAWIILGLMLAFVNLCSSH
ncbi:hypothetical protein [uncultured Dialister sp.]|jgi:hypothetical protein|uniref:hypothetical protein n=1 Tax=uncultured Dialister sp. TaxID=278064 RepID=UPI00266F8FEA|nr:hypothetical protein [uncultured Dialister sp.]